MAGHRTQLRKKKSVEGTSEVTVQRKEVDGIAELKRTIGESYRCIRTKKKIRDGQDGGGRSQECEETKQPISATAEKLKSA